MPTGGSELERASSPFLPPDFGEVGPARAVRRGRRLDGTRVGEPSKVRARLGQVLDGNGLDAGESRLRRRFRRTDEPVESGSLRGFRGDERPGHRTHAPVERELTEGGVEREPRRRNLVRGGEHRERDRQVEARSLLAKARGSEVDRDPAQRPLELRARDPAPHALLGLLARLVGQADDRERGHASL